MEQAWNKPVAEAIGPLQVLATKLQNLTRQLQSWSQKRVGNVATQLTQATELLHRLEIARDMRGLHAGEEWLRKQIKQHCPALTSLQRTIARLCSRVLWLGEGDANTGFFHSHARYWRRKNFIAKLKVGERIVTNQEEKQEVV